MQPNVLRSLVVLSLCSVAGSAQAAPDDPPGIIGGAPVASCSWPSTVFLENCTGTLIHPEIVVYAAHCGDDRERVWFGEDISTGTRSPDGAGFSVDTEYCMVNPGYGTATEIGPSRANDYAFCKLAEPVLDVPIVPPLAGCENTILTPGREVTLVGYGGTDQNTFGVKFEVDTVLHYIDDWGAAVIGGGGQSPCAGDSGGPAFVQLPDGTWRAFAIVSGPNFGNCGDAMWFATIPMALPFIEANSGIDVSACHYNNEGWNPSPTCGDFPLDPRDGAGKSWADGCSGGPALEWSSTCGPPFDASEDLTGPTATIVTPEDRARFDTEDGAATYAVSVEAEVDDDISGVAQLSLEIDGAPVDGSLRLGTPWTWDLGIPPGVWEIVVVATDWAGNTTSSAPVVIGIDEDPPAKPEPSTSSGEPASSSGAAADTSGGGSSTGPIATGSSSGGGSSSDTGGAAATADGGGCGCTAQGDADAGWLVFALLSLGRWLRARRRRAALSWTVLAACSDPAPSAADTGSSTGSPTTSTSGVDTTTTDATTTDATATDATTGTTSTGEGSTGPTCELGTEQCGCSETFTCNVGLTCLLDTCVPCDAGTLACPCHYDEGAEEGTCDEGLYCFGGLCAAPQPCPYLMDGQCDEPQGSGACLIGTDAFDCCATMPDVCEEQSQGGRCPDGSDPDDCAAGESSSGSGGSDSGGSGSSGSGGSDSGSSGSGSTGI